MGSFFVSRCHLQNLRLTTSFDAVVSIVRIELPTVNPAVHRGAGRRTLSLPCSRPIALRKISAGFTCRRDVVCTGPLQDLFRPLHPGRIIAVDRKQNAAVLDTAFVSLGLIFWNAHPYQSSSHPS